MFKRSLVFIVLIVCVLSLISINNISYAGTSLGTWLNAERDVRNAERVMNTERDNYHYIQGDLKSLMGEWDDAEIANNNQRLLSVLAVGGAIVSVASGGSLYPAAYVVAVTLAKTNHNEATYDVQKSAYLTSMSGLLSLMDTARSNVDAAYNSGYLSKEPKGAYTGSVGYIEYTPGYVPEYNAYLQVALDHLNSYQYYQGNDYNNVVTLTLAGLTASVKSGTLKGWYHKKYHDGDKNSKTDHGFEKFMTFADFVVHPDLPKNYACKGNSCSDLFRTPYEALTTHRQKCGKEETQSISDLLAILSIGDTTGLAWRKTRGILAKRSVEDGCGDDWYSCDSDHATQEASHRVRTCKIEIPQSGGGTNTCGDSFRRCMEHKKDHDESTILNGKTVHSITPDSTTTETTENQYVAPEPTPVPTPSYHTCGVHQTSVSGDHSTAGCGVSGHYVCDGSDHSLQASCTTTNSSGQSCTVSSFYACQSHTHVYPAPVAVSCGRSGCTQTVSSSTEHQVTCSAGHQYWSCGQYANWLFHQHRVVTCKFTSCQQTWQKCTGGAPMCRAASRQGEKCWGLPASP